MIRLNTSPEIEQYFEQAGPLAAAFPGFEPRTEQAQMACAVYGAMLKGRRLVVEAGTGVGKSFAYLVPVIHNTVRHGQAHLAKNRIKESPYSGKLQNRRPRTLISTFTITLQEQLINKDIPALAKTLPQSFSAQLAKGRANYLCLRRLKYALRRSRGFFTQIPINRDELERINRWSAETADGSLSDLPFVPSAQAWDAVRSEHGNCPAAKCNNFRDCFWRRARGRLDTADIIIANHALMFSDLILKEQGHPLLPDYDFVVIDEAHNIESVAQDHFGIDISNRRVSYLLDKLYNSRTRGGLLAYNKQAQKAVELVDAVRTAGRRFFRDVRNWYQRNVEETGGKCHGNFVEDCLSGHLKLLRAELSSLAKKTGETDERYEITRFANLAAELVIDLQNFMTQQLNQQVYWVEPGEQAGTAIRLKSAPLNVGEDVKRTLFDTHGTVVLTSATLSCDNSRSGLREEDAGGGFDFFAGRIGLEDFDALKLGSPFDYQKQVTVYIEKDLPEPNEPDFADCAAAAIKRYVLKTAGRAFVLFTSYEMLNKVAERTAEWFDEQGFNFLRQGDRFDRSTMLKKFKARERGVLFGTDSFWQGVDVPGAALSNVIIVRLPFAVPNHPLVAGRIEQIRQEGGNPFYEYQLPSAIIKFKQGFGRLIRNKTDTGIVAVLDSRIINKKYGQRFLSSIPQCRIEVVGSGV